MDDKEKQKLMEEIRQMIIDIMDGKKKNSYQEEEMKKVLTGTY